MDSRECREQTHAEWEDREQTTNALLTTEEEPIIELLYEFAEFEPFCTSFDDAYCEHELAFVREGSEGEHLTFSGSGILAQCEASAGSPPPPSQRPGANGVSGYATAVSKEQLKRKDDLPQQSAAQKCSWHAKDTHRIRCRQEGGTKIVNEYHLLETVGTGTFGKVKRAIRRAADGSAEREFAVKIIDKDRLAKIKEYGERDGMMVASTAMDKVRKEIEIMRHLYHRNVILLFEIIEDISASKMYLVLEYMALGPVMRQVPQTQRFVSPVTESTVSEDISRRYIRDIASGLRYLHGLGIVHRDLKPDNILLSQEGQCRISDFNSAHRFYGQERDSGMLSDTVGTFTFLSPEECSGEPFNAYRADVWALGVTLYIFTFGTYPFLADGIGPLLDRIRQSDVEYPEEPQTSSELSDLLLRLLCKDPKERTDLQGLLSHPWVTGIPDTS